MATRTYLIHEDVFNTPQEALKHFDKQHALKHYGTKGMKWGVRKNDSAAGRENGQVGDPVLAVYAVVIGGVLIAKARFNYVDSGRQEARRTDKDAKKSGKEHEWKKNDKLSGKKTVDELFDQVVPGVNPGYPSAGTSMNCRRATMTYEMRRRGLDVTATKTLAATGQDLAGIVNATTPGSKLKTVWDPSEVGYQSYWGQNTIPTTVDGTPMTSAGKAKSIFDTLSREPEGSRGELAFSWTLGGGHSTAYEIVGGKPVVFCTQTRNTWREPTKFGTEYGPIVRDAAYTRLDNKPLNDDFMKRWATNVK